jgi:hypothetical protein
MRTEAFGRRNGLQKRRWRRRLVKRNRGERELMEKTT